MYFLKLFMWLILDLVFGMYDMIVILLVWLIVLIIVFVYNLFVFVLFVDRNDW